ncbi:MAG: hypothetical protein NW220_18395 [Leptolyngbyaceae cyanobacterium bins.349]|nr:hypothetical protein [Leptolyngbyaceae cyanobacterium bins.349]
MMQPSEFNSANNTEAQKAIVQRLRHDPQFAGLYNLAQQGATELPEEKLPHWFYRWLLSIFVANPKEFYGKAFVTDELKETATLTARVVSASSLIDFLCNQPLWFFIFADQGGLLALLLGTAANACLTKITNDCATAAAGRKPKRHAVANAALIGAVGMNTLLSSTSGIGGELK